MSKLKIIYISLAALFLCICLLLWYITTPKDPSEITIMLDPGHGGSLAMDKGAFGVDKETHEHTLNDSVCALLYLSLREEGYNVIFSREPYKDEEELSLEERANIANEKQPDIFISIHQDSTGEDKPKTGYSVYYASFKINLDVEDVYVLYNEEEYVYLYEEINEYGNVLTYYLDGEETKILHSGEDEYKVIDKSPSKEGKDSLKLANAINDSLGNLDYINPLSTSEESVIDKEFRVLRKTNVPAVLVECGFMSDEEELEEIKKVGNQEKLVYEITNGVNNYFKRGF